MKKPYLTLLFALSLLALGSTAIAIAPNPFTDVPQDHWAYSAIEKGRLSGLWEGYADGTFGLGKNITREELAVVLDRSDMQMNQSISNLQTQMNALRTRVTELEKELSAVDDREEDQDDEDEENSLESALHSGSSLREINAPNLDLPSGVHEGQIEEYFSLGDFRFALAMDRSRNVNLNDLPNSFDASFRGILISEKGDDEWRKFLKIEDNTNAGSDENNPYYLWKEGDRLFLSIVDEEARNNRENEGVEKVYSTDDGESWVLENCYYFGSYENHEPSSNFSDVNDYFEHSRNLNELRRLTGDEGQECKNDVDLTVYNL